MVALAPAAPPVSIHNHLGISGTVYAVEDVAPIIEKIVQDLNHVADQRHAGEIVGGLQRLAESWAARAKNRTSEAAIRRLYAFRNYETVCASAAMIDELFVSQHLYTSDFDLPIFAGSINAGVEMADAWLRETSDERYTPEAARSLGRTLYHFSRGYFSWDLVDAEDEEAAA